MPFPIPGVYHIDWYIGIGTLFNNIFPIFPSILYFVATFEGSYTDKNHVPNPQGCCPTSLIIISFVSLCFFGLKCLTLLGVLPDFLNKLGHVWLCNDVWSQTKCDIYGKMRLSPKHEKVGAESCS